MLFTKEMVRPLYYGSLFNACGGGEYSDHLPLLVERFIEENGPISCISLDDFPDDGIALSVGIMGSMLESSLQTGKEGVQVVSRLCEQLDITYDAIFTIEASSLNVLFPILIAGMLKTPIIDGDCMGRAFPEFQMTTAEAIGEKIAPMSIVTPKGEYYYFDDLENLLFEVQAREIVSHENGIAYFAGFPLEAKRLKSVILPKTLSFTYEIGFCFLKPSSYARLLEDIIEVTKNSIYGSAIELFVGTITSIEPTHDGGRVWTNISLDGVGAYQNSKFSILSQNEALIAFRDNQIAAMVPDLITLIDMRTLRPLSNISLHAQMKVAVLGIPVPVRLKSKAMLTILGPACFGYNQEYVPLEKIHAHWYFG